MKVYLNFICGDLSSDQSIYISQNNPIGFSNRERLAAPLINLYMVKCQVTKTIEGAQEPPERGRRETSQASHSRATRHMQPIQAGTQTAHQDTQTTPQESLPKRRASSCTQGGSNQTTKMPPQGEAIDNCSCFDVVWCRMVLSTPEKMMKQSSMLRTMVGGDLEEELDSPLKGGWGRLGLVLQ